MTTKIGLKMDEYTVYKNILQKAHIDNMDQISNIMSSISELCNSDGGFYMENLSPQIADLMAELQQFKTIIEDIYNVHWETIKSFEQTIDNYDTSC